MRLAPRSGPRTSDRSPAWIGGVCTLAGAQILLGLLGLAVTAAGWVEWQSATVVRDWQRALEAIAFSGLAAYLLWNARGDTRAVHLGALLLLIATFYAQPPMEAFERALPGWAAVPVGFLRAVPVDAFTPAVAWLFMRDFPRALDSPRSAAVVRWAIATCVAIALVLIAANVARAYAPPSAFVGWLAVLDRGHPWSRYWTVLFAPLLPLLPFVVWRTRHASREERGRVRLFGVGVAIFGAVPVVYTILAPLVSDLAQGEWAQTVIVPTMLVTLFALAATWTYCVVVDDVLDVRVVLRSAAQYALARGVAWSLAIVPFALIASVVYGARNEPLTALFGGTRPLQILGLAAAGGLALRVRRRVMLAVDRIFFREPYDSQRVLASIAARTRDAGSTAALGQSVGEELSSALHLESIAILATAPDGDDYVPIAGPARRLGGSSKVLDLFSAGSESRVMDVLGFGEPLASLPEPDRQWIADSGAAALVSMTGLSGELTGLLAVGPKRSQLPFSQEDVLLLEAVGGAVGAAIENRALRDSAGMRERAGAEEDRGSECVECGSVGAAGRDRCERCGGATRAASLPRRVLGKFELDRRIGEGAMGIVYCARDLALGRDVALKTLPTTVPEDAVRLRREARAMAAVTHPNLAMIHGAETWMGTPVLVMEFLGGGTLQDRLPEAPLPPAEAFGLAIAMADVLARVHAEGLLHRDVKPSNIGFTADGHAKLLDFGLARIVGEKGATLLSPDHEESDDAIGGTPLYMSPEALMGARPEPGFDLWSLAVVTCEMVCGVHPFERSRWSETMNEIRGGWNDAILEHVPSEAQPVVPFFERSLAHDRGKRPAHATEFAAALRTARDALS